MGNISASFFLPSPKTALCKFLFLAGQKLGLKDFEISDHSRGVIKVSFTWENAKAPAVALKRRLRNKLSRQPGAVAVVWTNTSSTTTALTLHIEHF